jgi:GNAT superfamily N-acetyltransferase
MPEIKEATTDADIRQCFPVMTQLRPHLRPGEFVSRIRRQQHAGGYRLLFVEENGDVLAVAGFRVLEGLAWGRYLYVDDLVRDAAAGPRGLGSLLFDRLLTEARNLDCDQFHLDSGVQRFDAHRFYLHKGLDISSHHFSLVLK